MTLRRKAKSCLYIIFLLVGTTGGVDFHCSDVTAQGCNCSDNYSDDYLITCMMENFSSFLVNIEPSKYVQVRCNKIQDISDFYLNLTSKDVPAAQQLYIRYCSVPQNMSLSSVARRVNAAEVEDLLFESVANQSDNLHRDHLSGFPKLKKLILSSNGLTSLPEDVFAGLSGLTRLNLRDNSLTRLPVGIFRYTPHLKDLELGMNNLESIEPGTFNGLVELTLLNIWRNRLKTIEPGTFDQLTALKGLDLNSNLLEDIGSDVFAKLQNLETLNLFGNNFTSLPADLLKRNKKLKRFNVNYNQRNITTLPERFFGNLTVLEELMVKRSGIRNLPGNLFRGSNALKNIDLQRNFLLELPEDIFQGLRILKHLNLAFNDLETLPDHLFEDLSSLEMLDLSKNRFTVVTRNMFVGLSSLKELNMNGNHLSIIHEQSFYFLTNLHVAKFSNNRLTLQTNLRDEFGKRSPFHKCAALTELHLDRNNITDIFADWVISSLHLRKLDLRHNNIQRVEAEDLQFVSREIDVYLSHNKIQHIYLSRAELIAGGRSEHHRIHINIDENPLSCDCYLYDLLRNLEGKMSDTVKNMFIIEAGNLRCASPPSLADAQVVDLNSANFTCALPDEELQAQCPGPCSCKFRPDDKAYLVDCSRRNLTDAPGGISIPRDLRVELNLTGNRLVQFPRFLADNVVQLVLAENNIADVPVNALETYSSTLEILELHQNNLSSLSSEVLTSIRNFSSLTYLSLHSNPWQCDCDSRDLLSFVQTTKALDSSEKSQIICANLNKSLSDLTLNEICPLQTGTIIGVSLAVAILGLILGAIAALYYRYQQEIKVWLYAHRCCLCLVTEDELDKNKLYDAFISYSHKDEEFIVNELVPSLENGPRAYKLCLHYRDWLAGEWIPAQIARSVEESRRTVIVLSPNFLDSVWGRMEFRAAHNQALSEGRARVIVILYGEIGPTDNLDPELKAYLSMNTYVKWGDPWFWDKLRYALPHSSDIDKNALRKNKFFENHQPSITVDVDKKGLVCPANEPETPTGEVTPPADSLKVFICDGKSRNEQSNKTLITGVDKANVTPDKKIFRKIQCTTV